MKPQQDKQLARDAMTLIKMMQRLRSHQHPEAESVCQMLLQASGGLTRLAINQECK